jgi:hypothetical protein
MLKLRLMVLMAAVAGAGGLFAGCDDDEPGGGTGGMGGTAGTGGMGGTAGTGGTGGSAGTGGTGGGGVDADASGGTGGDAGDETGPIPTDPAQICLGMQKYCERFNACAPYYIGLEFGTVAKCTERLTIQCLDAVAAPGSGLDGTAMVACTAALETASCNDLFNRTIPACNFKGTRANGMACGTDEQCSSGRCAKSMGACGTCADFAADGAACGFDEDCAPGRLCNEDDRCVVPAMPQATCSTARPCQYGFACVAAACQPSVTTAGGACGSAGCSLPHGLYCGSGNTCAAIPLNAPAAVCRDSTTMPAHCAGGTCILGQTGDTGTCFAFAADGQACGDASDNELDCQAPSLCVADKCAPPNSASCN